MKNIYNNIDMIATFKVKNFLSFKEFQELSFVPSREKRFDEYCCVEVSKGVRLLRTALILGANASGKTNLLLALECLKDLATDAPSDKTKPVNVQSFLLDDASEFHPTIFDIEFYLAGEKYDEDTWVEIDDAEPCPICFRMIKNSGIDKIVSKKGILKLRYPLQ